MCSIFLHPYTRPNDFAEECSKVYPGMQDALDEIARQKPRDVFKPLRVHFIGEDGIDAGGVKKEFFQLLVTELLCPDYGMLIFQSVRDCIM